MIILNLQHKFLHNEEPTLSFVLTRTEMNSPLLSPSFLPSISMGSRPIFSYSRYMSYPPQTSTPNKPDFVKGSSPIGKLEISGNFSKCQGILGENLQWGTVYYFLVTISTVVHSTLTTFHMRSQRLLQTSRIIEINVFRSCLGDRIFVSRYRMSAVNLFLCQGNVRKYFKSHLGGHPDFISWHVGTMGFSWFCIHTPFSSLWVPNILFRILFLNTCVLC